MKLPAPRKIEHTNSPWQQLVGGVKYAVGSREIKGLILLSSVFSIFGVSYTTILPAFVENELHRGAIASGLSLGETS